MAFCQSFMTELCKYIGADTDVPAGDIGTGAREIGFMFGQYKRIRGVYEGVLTGKGLSYGGSLARTEATGYGLLYLTQELLKLNGIDIAGKTACVSGSGNVAIYAIEKATQLGVKVLTCSDSNGWVYDPDGIDVAALKEIKEVNRARLTEYKKYRPNSEYHEGRGVWVVKADLALPCATQNELLLEDAKALVENGCTAVCEGANMPTTLEATKYLQEHGVNALRINKISPESPNVMDLILGHKIDLVIDTPTQGNGDKNRDGFLIRRNAIETGVYCITAMDTANALAQSLETATNELTPIDIATVKNL